MVRVMTSCMLCYVMNRSVKVEPCTILAVSTMPRDEKPHRMEKAFTVNTAKK